MLEIMVRVRGHMPATKGRMRRIRVSVRGRTSGILAAQMHKCPGLPAS